MTLVTYYLYVCTYNLDPFLTYPKRSIDMGGEEGGVCMDPAMVREELAQWGLWWSPFNLSGGVNMPPPPSVI